MRIRANLVYKSGCFWSDEEKTWTLRVMNSSLNTSRPVKDNIGEIDSAFMELLTTSINERNAWAKIFV